MKPGRQKRRDEILSGRTPGGAKKTPARPTPDARAAAREMARLREALQEAQETLNAIRSGEVDAVVVNGAKGNQIYSLAGAEQPYRVYVEQMQEGAVTVSPDGTILYCNQRFANMVGLPLEKAIGSDLRQYLTPGAWEKLALVFEAGEDVVKHEATLRVHNDGELPVHLTANRLPLEAQLVMCLVVTDLTAQKERGELQLAKEIAEKANLSKDAFLAALSHELRTPLNPALMAAVALEQDESLPEFAQQQLAMIRRNVELEARLIDDLLDLTRIAQGKLELHSGAMDVHAVLARAVEICQSEINDKQQQLILRLEAADTQTTGDAVRVQQILWNLLRNAAKFTPVKGAISIRTGNREGAIWIEVTDNGIGFTSDAQPKLFMAFEQGGRHITRQFGGLGLGLAISRSIAEAHGGSIRAESAGVGHGATFTLELPIRASSGRAVAPADSSPAAAPAEKLRVLLVEDHRDTRVSMEFLLRKAGYIVFSADSAQAAIDLAAQHPFDVVVTDLGLPDKSGLEMMRELSAAYGLIGIATSGYGMEEDVEQSRRAGFLHHFTKPISMDHLRRVLAEVHARKQAG